MEPLARPVLRLARAWLASISSVISLLQLSSTSVNSCNFSCISLLLSSYTVYMFSFICRHNSDTWNVKWGELEKWKTWNWTWTADTNLVVNNWMNKVTRPSPWVGPESFPSLSGHWCGSRLSSPPDPELSCWCRLHLSYNGLTNLNSF